MLKGPVVIDLFAGAGGFSLGFRHAGYNIHAAIEIDKWACQTFQYNFPETKVIQMDIQNIKTDYIKKLINVKPDIIIGGPPCQGFSVSVPGGPGNRDPKDPRNTLFMEFIRFLNILQPKAFIIENVKGLLTSKNQSKELVINIIEDKLIECNYIV